MKSLKKLLSIFAAFMMVVGLTAANVKAAETLQTVPSGKDGTGEITVSNTTIGQSYGVYKIFNGTNGTNATAYTATTAVKNLLSGDDSPFTFTNKVGDEWQVEIKDGKTGSEIIDFLKEKIGDPTSEGWTAPSGIESTVSPTAAIATSMKFTQLQFGYYFVSSSLGATVTINAANPSATVIDKNQGGPTTDGNLKTIVKNGEKTEVSANFGDTIDCQMSIVATNYNHDKPIKSYQFEDTLGNGLKYVMNNNNTVDVTVTVTPKSTITESNPNGTSVDVTAQATVKMGSDNQSFTLTLPWATGTAENPIFYYETNSIVKVTYKATVQNTADLNSDTNTKNTGKFGYTEFGKDTPIYPTGGENSTTVKTYGLGIVKTDEKGNPLQGAQFTVTPQGSTTPIKVSGPTQDDDGNNVYLYDPNGTATITTPATGIVIIKGIANEGTDSKDLNYDVKETVAPNGYNLLQGSKTVTATELSSSTTTIKWYKDKDGNVTTESTTNEQTTDFKVNVAGQVIVNTKGAQLPSTGGMGTTMLYVAGAILMVGAAVIFVTNKRMKHE
ncbi:SpaA isopeptide-forming pilin-related protein [uncultured Dubosiella sp.]|uniref:SpaA isopeptide-forming pilin-related protein n=1 Tax=uncultured Dubosiella sp. TaxID=1937011 RepID=UPI0025A51285|nr:SpaA isopeptide-forming pilin-related protein [uncultured Dubosiella sp.]